MFHLFCGAVTLPKEMLQPTVGASGCLDVASVGGLLATIGLMLSPPWGSKILPIETIRSADVCFGVERSSTDSKLKHYQKTPSHSKSCNRVPENENIKMPKNATKD